MTGKPLTPLQKQLYGVKTIRQTMREVIAGSTGFTDGYLRVWDEIIKQGTVADMTDNQIRDILYTALYDPETPREDRERIEKILHLR